MIEQFLNNLPNNKIVNKKNRLSFDFSDCTTPQNECCTASWIIPTKETPAEIRVLYDALLVQNKTPEKLRSYYKKGWVI